MIPHTPVPLEHQKRHLYCQLRSEGGIRWHQVASGAHTTTAVAWECIPSITSFCAEVPSHVPIIAQSTKDFVVCQHVGQAFPLPAAIVTSCFRFAGFQRCRPGERFHLQLQVLERGPPGRGTLEQDPPEPGSTNLHRSEFIIREPG